MIATRIDSRTYRIGDAHGDFTDTRAVDPWERTVPRLTDKRGYSQKGAPVDDARPIVAELVGKCGSFASAERESGIPQATLRGIAMKRYRSVNRRVYERLLEWKAGRR